jgi:hypothetical protein
LGKEEIYRILVGVLGGRPLLERQKQKREENNKLILEKWAGRI